MTKAKGKKVLMARKVEVEIGMILQDPKYNVVMGYGNGYSQMALAKELKKRPELSKYDQRRIAHGIVFALVGNDDPQLGKVYSGSMSLEAYKIHAKRHVSNASRANCNILVQERRGLHGLDRDKLKEFALRSTLSRGLIPWTEEEREYAFSRSENYRTEEGIVYKLLAADVNNQFHNGKSVRTEHSVKGAVRTLKIRKQERIPA
jgi:hypothetical protein